MDLEITTPAVLFPALSLLLLAYTNRFITLSGLIRQMNVCAGNEYELSQLKNLSIIKMAFSGRSIICTKFIIDDCVFILFVKRNKNIIGCIKDSFKSLRV